MRDVELYWRVRYAVRIDGISRREAARRFGIDPRTVAKMLSFSVPPGYRRSQPPARPKPEPARLDMTVYPSLPRPRGAHLGPDLPGSARQAGVLTDTPQVLPAHHLKVLKLPTFLREYEKLARQCASDAVDPVRYLLRLAELELIEREHRMVERRIKEAKFPAGKASTASTFWRCRR